MWLWVGCDSEKMNHATNHSGTILMWIYKNHKYADDFTKFREMFSCVIFFHTYKKNKFFLFFRKIDGFVFLMQKFTFFFQF